MGFLCDIIANTDGSISLKKREGFISDATEKILSMQDAFSSKPINRKINIGPLYQSFNEPNLPNIFK